MSNDPLVPPAPPPPPSQPPPPPEDLRPPPGWPIDPGLVSVSSAIPGYSVRHVAFVYRYSVTNPGVGATVRVPLGGTRDLIQMIDQQTAEAFRAIMQAASGVGGNALVNLTLAPVSPTGILAYGNACIAERDPS